MYLMRSNVYTLHVFCMWNTCRGELTDKKKLMSFFCCLLDGAQDGTERECSGEFSLLSPHICRVAQSASSSARSFKSGNKRKRKGEGSPHAVDGKKGKKEEVKGVCVEY